MIKLFKKELAFYFNHPVGYIVASLFAVLANFLFVKDLFLRGDASMRVFFNLLPWLLVVFVPAAAMRLFAEEKRTNTFEILLTLPISETAIVAAKFLALSVFVLVALSQTLLIPALLMFIGEPAIVEVAAAYVGGALMVAAFIALSLFFSSLTANQVIAFLSSSLALFFLILAGTEFVNTVLPPFLQTYTAFLSPLYHYENFLKGLIDGRSVVYFLTLALVFLFLTVVNVEKRD